MTMPLCRTCHNPHDPGNQCREAVPVEEQLRGALSETEPRLTPLQHAFAMHVLHRAWTHQLHLADFDAMRVILMAENRVADNSEISSDLVTLCYAIANWRSGNLSEHALGLAIPQQARVAGPTREDL